MNGPAVAASIKPFVFRQAFYPLALGTQVPLLGAGGPSGFASGTAAGFTPWPYITKTKQFFWGYPYGAASSKLGNSGVGQNYWTQRTAYQPVGYYKPQTGPQQVF